MTEDKSTQPILIRIEGKHEHEAFMRSCKVRLKIQWLSNARQLKGLLIAALIVLVTGFCIRTPREPGNPYITIGLFLSGIWLLMLYSRLSGKSRYLQSMDKLSRQYAAANFVCTYEFSDDSVKYRDNEKHIDYKWSVFSSYSIYGDYLVMMNGEVVNYLFEKDTKEYQEILQLVAGKLNYVKLG